MIQALNTSRINLRLLEEHDAVAFFSLIKNNYERVAEYFPISVNSCTSLETTKVFIQTNKKMFLEKERFFYGIISSDSKQIIGAVFLMRPDWHSLKCEVGYYIDKKMEGKGFASEAVNLLSKHAHTELGLNKLVIRVTPNNKASAMVAKKCNYNFEALLKSEFKLPNGKIEDVEYYSLIKNN